MNISRETRRDESCKLNLASKPTWAASLHNCGLEDSRLVGKVLNSGVESKNLF